MKTVYMTNTNDFLIAWHDPAERAQAVLGIHVMQTEIFLQNRD